MIAIIDYGVGNLFSLKSSLKSLGVESVISRNENEISMASHIILPGVGAFADAMDKLSATGLVPFLKGEVKYGKSLLGICLGMQLLFEQSLEYGEHEGLGLVKGCVVPLKDALEREGFEYKVPHMGWNRLDVKRPDCPIMRYTKQGDYVYYVHSFYAAQCERSLVASSEYGISVTGAVANRNVYGTQFHPEKSGRAGLNILKAFCEI